MRKFMNVGAVLMVAAALAFGGMAGRVGASSHREAPLISADPQADATDLYAWVSSDRPDSVTLVANYIPLEAGYAGPNFYKFGDDVLYEINIDNNGDALDDIVFQFRFRSVVQNPNTFLYNTGPVTAIDDPDLNQRQYYSVSVLGRGGERDPQRSGRMIADNLQVAPANVGPKSYPEGYGKVAMQAVRDIGNGIKVFAGPRDDPFFVDLGGIFDLLSGIRGRDDLGGLNVHTIALQVPIAGLRGPNGSVIGVRTTSWRRAVKVLGAGQAGPWVQVSRLDMPLVNEVVVPLGAKDLWNSSQPKDDGQFLAGVQNPELAGLLNAILKVDVPANPRGDIVTIFLTGIPELNQPANVRPTSQLRLNMAVPPGNMNNRMGLLGGDVAGFPNGRRLADDVVDIELQALAGATPFTPDFNKAPNNQLGDNVNANDVAFMPMFPYLAEPNTYPAE
jgi:hypothetical protein